MGTRGFWRLALILSLDIGFAKRVQIRKGVAPVDDDLGPSMNIHTSYLVVSSNSTFSITCEGYYPISWNTTIDPELDDRAVFHQRRLTKGYKSTITITESHYSDTGRFSCYYSVKETGSEARVTTVYVYVTDPEHLLVPKGNPANGDLVIEVMREGHEGLIPCRPTHPAVNITLIKFPEPQINLQEGDVEFNPTKGFVIKYPNIFFTGLFECKATLGRQTQNMNFHVIWLTNNESPPRPNINNELTQLTVKDGSFNLTCSLTVEPQRNITISWTYPNSNNPNVDIVPTEHIPIQSENGYEFVQLKSTLIVSRINMADGGRYSCIATGEDDRQEEDSVYLPIESSARIVSSNLNGQVLHAELDDDLKLFCIVDGYPKPSLQWFKNGRPIDKTSDRRYRLLDHQFRLVIVEVIPSDVGQYSCLTINKLGSASRNITIALFDSSDHLTQKIISEVSSAPSKFSLDFFILTILFGLWLCTNNNNTLSNL